MPAGYYVHNIYNKDITSEFGRAQREASLQYQLKTIKDINTSLKNRYKKVFGTVKGYTQAVKELERTLPTAAQAMLQNLPTINWNPIRGALAVQDVQMLQKAVSKMKADITQYQDFYDEIVSHGGDTTEGPVWLTQGDMDRIAALYTRLAKAKEDLDKLDIARDDRWGISQQLSRTIGSVAGFISEYGITEILNEMSKHSNIQFRQVGASGGKAKSTYSTGTEDIGVSVVDGTGEIVAKLPGITLKRTSTHMSGSGSKKQPEIDIHLKTTSVGQLISFGQMGESGFNLETFYNAYANANRKALNFETQSEVINKVTGMDNLYKSFKTAALATALTGSLNIYDFAYYLVVNDEVFTADQIITGVMTGQGSVIGGHVKSLKGMSLDEILNQTGPMSLEAAQPAVANRHRQIFYELLDNNPDNSLEEAQSRSEQIIAVINAISVSLNLKMKLPIVT